MSSFWSGWIIILTVGNILACFWLIWWTMRSKSGEAATGDVTGHTWDGDLQEYNNPLPRWWLGLFYITLAFAAIYLALYPGLGAFKGLLGWSSHGSQYGEEMAAAEERYGPKFAQFRGMAIPAVAANEEALGMGKRLYLTYCMQCHGSDARGARGFPNLADADWQWGGAPEQILASIANGRNAVMPAQAHLGEEAIDGLTAYVASLSGRDVDAAKAAKGKETFTTAGCVACHGMDGKGNPLLGAPNLTDNVWLYGGSEGIIRQSIANGRNGVMPAHKDLLGEDKVHLLAAYVYSLSQ